jgi:hypothetical protein
MKRENSLISKLVDKVLNETIEERANSLVSRLKHKEMKETHTGSKIKGIINSMKGEVNELGGMDDGHPKLGHKRLKKDMSDDEIDDILNQLRSGDDDDFEDGVDEMPPFKRGRRDYEDDDFDNELEENYDSEELQNHFDDEEYDEFNFEPMDDIRPNLRDLEGGTTHGREFMKDFEDKRDFIKKLRRGFRGEENEEQLYEIEMEPQGKVCEQCGVGEMSEGVCNECGSSSGMMDESEDMEVTETNIEGCKTVKEVVKSQNGEVTELDQQLMERYNCGSLKESLIRRGLMKESLKGNQKKIDKNKNNKIDSEDFALLRKGKKTETKEGSKPDFLDLDKDGDKKEPMKKASKDKKGKKETVRVTESELIALIEEMVNEEFETIGTKPRGLSEYERAHKKSGSENKEYFKSLKKKMDDYLSDGSKGDYEENPKHFPKGNGQLAKMKAKKYDMSDDGKEFIDDYMRPGMENLDYDEVHPNEDWMTKNIEGSSETGNNPKWANAEETELGERLNKKRKANKLAKAKRQAYNKAPQPVVSDKTGDDKGTGIHIKVESTDKQTKVLNEEFDKIKNLMNYNRKTQ